MNSMVNLRVSPSPTLDRVTATLATGLPCATAFVDMRMPPVRQFCVDGLSQQLSKDRGYML